MKRVVNILVVLGLAALPACSSSSNGNSSPTAPSSGTPTKIIALGGNLDFGPVTLGQTATGLLTIMNTGNATMTVSSISLPCGAQFVGSTTSGPVTAGATLSVTVRFTPTGVENCNGTITVTADQTGGTNTISITASGTLNGVPIFTMSGVGNTVFTIPSYVTRIQITATYTGYSSNWIVNGAVFIDDLVGTGWGLTVDSGTYATTGGTVAITSSTGVAWTFTEVR
jgi:hypothetical protein